MVLGWTTGEGGVGRVFGTELAHMNALVYATCFADDSLTSKGARRRHRQFLPTITGVMTSWSPATAAGLRLCSSPIAHGGS
ncbi:hypothetical protein Dimus_028825 [Dionaea muscipula]